MGLKIYSHHSIAYQISKRRLRNHRLAIQITEAVRKFLSYHKSYNDHCIRIAVNTVCDFIESIGMSDYSKVLVTNKAGTQKISLSIRKDEKLTYTNLPDELFLPHYAIPEPQ